MARVRTEHPPERDVHGAELSARPHGPRPSRAAASASRPSSTCLTSRRATARQPGWNCTTIVDGEAMSKEDAMFIARNYAIEHNVPVIYECHSE